jgi:hypothetical protein
MMVADEQVILTKVYEIGRRVGIQFSLTSRVSPWVDLSGTAAIQPGVQFIPG